MAQRIIYNNGSGGVSCVTPTPEWLELHTLEELAAIVVPQGAEYQIVDESEIPPDPPPDPIPDWDTFRRSLMTSTAWTVAIAPVNETCWQLAAIITAIKGDVDPQVVAQLWNALDLGNLQVSHITQLRGAVTINHIPLVVADNGTITPT